MKLVLRRRAQAATPTTRAHPHRAERAAATTGDQFVKPAHLATNAAKGNKPVDRAEVAVILCSDVLSRPEAPVSLESISSVLCSQAASTRVMAVRDLCARFSDLPEAIRSLGASRVVIGCAYGNQRRQRLHGVLCSNGAHPSALQVVDLSPTDGVGRDIAAEQSLARLRAAMARVLSADIEAPVREATAAPRARAISRRDLLGLGHAAPRPVATLAELEAAGRCLGEDARRLGLGVAITCSGAAIALPLGGPWLPLEVPSMEIVTAGWALQYVASGVPVAVMGCGGAACAGRAREITSLTAALIGEVAPERRCMVVPGDVVTVARATALPAASIGKACPGAPPLQFSEPAATVLALQQLTAECDGALAAPPSEGRAGLGPLGAPAQARWARHWRFESSAAPLGEVEIDLDHCSACGCCARACRTGALSSFTGQGMGLAFAFKANACSACGACVMSCPERAISLARAVSSTVLISEERVIALPVENASCPRCGRPMAGSPLARTVAERLALSHPELVARLRAAEFCTCRPTMAGLPVEKGGR